MKPRQLKIKINSHRGRHCGKSGVWVEVRYKVVFLYCTVKKPIQMRTQKIYDKQDQRRPIIAAHATGHALSILDI